jgi:hypothetical protein
MPEVHFFIFMDALAGEKTSGPRRVHDKCKTPESLVIYQRRDGQEKT